MDASLPNIITNAEQPLHVDRVVFAHAVALLSMPRNIYSNTIGLVETSTIFLFYDLNQTIRVAEEDATSKKYFVLCYGTISLVPYWLRNHFHFQYFNGVFTANFCSNTSLIQHSNITP